MAEEIVLSDRNVPRPPLQEELTRLYSQGFLTDITFDFVMHSLDVLG